MQMSSRPRMTFYSLYWPWDYQYTFSTMDIGGRRLIVKEDSSTGHYATFGSLRDPQNGLLYKTSMVEKWKKHLGEFREFNIDPETRHTNHVQTHSDMPHIGSSGKLVGRPQQTLMKDQSRFTAEILQRWFHSVYREVKRLMMNGSDSAARGVQDLSSIKMVLQCTSSGQDLVLASK